MTDGPIFVASGLASAGAARRVAERLRRATHVDTDGVPQLIVSGRAWPEARVWPDAPEMSAEAVDDILARLDESLVGA